MRWGLRAMIVLSIVANESHTSKVGCPATAYGQREAWVELLYIEFLQLVGLEHPVEMEAIDLSPNDRLLQISKHLATDATE